MVYIESIDTPINNKVAKYLFVYRTIIVHNNPMHILIIIFFRYIKNIKGFLMPLVHLLYNILYY